MMKPLCIATVMAMTSVTALPVSAEDAPKRDCDSQAEMVMEVVTARLEGVSKRKARRTLRKEMGRTAGDMLSDWVYSLPEEQLTDEVGEAWKTQCKAM